MRPGYAIDTYKGKFSFHLYTAGENQYISLPSGCQSAPFAAKFPFYPHLFSIDKSAKNVTLLVRKSGWTRRPILHGKVTKIYILSVKKMVLFLRECAKILHWWGR